jgi:hypothetical protein
LKIKIYVKLNFWKKRKKKFIKNNSKIFKKIKNNKEKKTLLK